MQVIPGPAKRSVLLRRSLKWGIQNKAGLLLSVCSYPTLPMFVFLGVFFLVLLLLAAFSWNPWDDCHDHLPHSAAGHSHHHQPSTCWSSDWSGLWLVFVVVLLLLAGWTMYSRRSQPSIQSQPQVLSSPERVPVAVPTLERPTPAPVNPVPVPRWGEKMVFISSDSDSESD